MLKDFKIKNIFFYFENVILKREKGIPIYNMTPQLLILPDANYYKNI
jgi:hypothetical protein